MNIYLVGGAVRDQLLGIKGSDRDYCVTGATPQEMLDLGFHCVGQDFPVFLHPKTGEEYALARTERKKGHGYKGFECHFSPEVTLEEDLVRRDLTINSIAQDANGQLYDPYGGVADLEQRILRHTSCAFVEDPLRVLRLARFYARFAYLGFKVAPETQELCAQIAASGELEHLTPERIWTETEKALNTKNPECYFLFLKETEALKHIFPQLDALSLVPEDPKYHPEGNVFAHSILTLKEVAKLTTRPDVRLAMLLHDLGKLETKVDAKPKPHFGHRNCATAHIKALANQIRMPKAYEKLALAIAFSHRYVQLLTAEPQELEEIFTKCGGYQEPFRIALLTLCLVADYRGTLAPKPQCFMAPYFMQYIFDRALKIKAEQAINEGYKGPDIGKRMTELRREAIAKAQHELIKIYGHTVM